MATQNTTTNTLIATFATYSLARQAARELEEIGVSSDSIHIESTQKTAGADSSGGYPTEEVKEDKHESGFSSWWHSLFSPDEKHEERIGYESALSSGRSILRASVPAEEVDEATDILNRLGAVDADDRGGVRVYSHGASYPAEQPAGGRTGTRATGMSPNSPAPSALSGFGSTAGAGTLAGESTAGASTDLNSSYTREFERSFGSDSNFEDSTIDENASQYGSRYAANPSYSGRSWSDVESDIRSNYERDNPGSTWDKMKNSVRSGWEKATDRR